MTHHDIPDTHPRKQSLMLREKIINGLGSNIVATAGLVAHGRGEAFDYILGEQTLPAARTAIDAAAALLTTATRPVISVNGNTAALSAPELVALSAVTGAPLEINLFYRSPEREQAILSHLTEHGATRVLGVGNRATGRVPDLAGPRGQVDPEGILQADVVFLALEDGDRTEQLARLGKKIIAVDLNPFSRTAQYAHVTIVDNIVRVMPL
ncbi:MAG TPA: phosphopantothenate/pantothenate synthetase, partial [Spirochaetia bacterium]|nr:phosphopantothenate/pantothenate synthetase [Spirochaetia bacterium]